MHQISFKNVSFSYNSHPVLEDINLIAEPGDFICLLGPSGCGKSTLLRLSAGLEKPSSGNILIDQNEIVKPGLDRGVVFQDYSLFPWMTIRQNIILALKQAFPDKSKEDADPIAEDFLELVGLHGSFDKLPRELSGGMKQRAAIALVFAISSPVLLMDEPFGALDAITRAHLQDLLLQLWNQNGRERKTVIFVTHDVDEAILLANKIVVLSLNPGRIRDVIAVDLPRPRKRQDLYTDPAFQNLRERIMNLLNESIVHQLDADFISGEYADRI
jgi:NitT/TauT family transport system ATP-binding protein